MKTKIEELEQLHAAATESARELKQTAADESRSLTDDEAKDFDRLMSEARTIGIDMDQELEMAKAIERQESFSKSERRTKQEPIKTQRVEVPRYGGTLRAFKGDRALERAYHSGQWVLGHLLGNSGAREYCREHGIEGRAMGEGIATKGGAIVPEVLEATIRELRDKYGVARQECDIMPMSSDTLTVPRMTSGPTVYYPGEGGEITASDAALDNFQLTAKKAAQLIRISSELTADTVVAIADRLAERAAYEFAKAEDEALFNGDGSPTYGGIVGIRTKMIDGDHAGSYVEAVAGEDLFSEITQPSLTSIVAVTPGYAEDNSKWFISKAGWGATMLRLATALAGNTMQSVQAGINKEYFGYPVAIASAMPTALTSLDAVAMILFGDLRQAVTLGDRSGMNMKVLEERYAEFDQIGILCTERYDINVHDIGDTTNRGPLVGLLGNVA